MYKFDNSYKTGLIKAILLVNKYKINILNVFQFLKLHHFY